jgi:hypothetical protein
MQEVENEDLKSVVTKENPLKSMFVDYVGRKINPSDGNVTVEMIVDVLSKEFPEFLMAVAEENFIRGYQQAFADLESSEPAKDKKAKRKK